MSVARVFTFACPIHLSLIAALLVFATSTASAIEIGDSAPALAIGRWVKGDEIKKFEPGKIYVIEFWATWCPPCRQSVPHLTQMQKRFGDKVVFIGVSNEEVDTIAPFVKEMGDKMDYIVAADDDSKTNAAYMKGAGVEGIPHAFVVNGDGKLAWHCHPMDGLDTALDRILAGTFDLAAAREKIAKLALLERDQRRLLAFSNAYLSEVSRGEVDEVQARESGRALEEKIKTDPSVANRIAWAILTGERVRFRDVELALRLSTAAVQETGGQESDTLETHARALHDNDKLTQAIDAQKKAIKLCTDDDMRIELNKSLARYQEEAKEPK